MERENASAHIVLGTGYGDEGKGSVVDYLSNKYKNPIVIRFSGGHQAGHTVEVGGVRHTHSSFGSGTFRNDIPTYLTEHTVFYPLAIERENNALYKKGCINPKLYIHPLAKMTTPWDVFDNRNCSDNLNHGTCGRGIGKTMERNEGPLKLYAIDLVNLDMLKEKLLNIKEYYNEKWKRTMTLPYFKTSNFVLELEEFYESLENFRFIIADYDILNTYFTLIFEGSQGILLDMDHGVFPNVTYANTTSKNALDVLSKNSFNVFPNIYYVTRSYGTRHGKGFFKSSDIKLDMKNGEEHNTYNIYQHKFKIGVLDYDRLNYAISVDKIYSKKCSHTLVVTCLDQYPNFFKTRVKHSFKEIIKSFSPDGSKMNKYTLKKVIA